MWDVLQTRFSMHFSVRGKGISKGTLEGNARRERSHVKDGAHSPCQICLFAVFGPKPRVYAKTGPES